MKIKPFTLVAFICLFLFSCSKEEDNTQGSANDPTSLIINKWWCSKPGTNTVAGQLFNSDGTWEQGNEGGTFNDKGNWKLESNKKTITLSNIKDNKGKAKSGWIYEISSVSEQNLKMKFGIIDMDLQSCK